MVARHQWRSATFEVEDLSDTFWVVSFEGTEALSTPFEFEIQVAARHVDVSTLLGRFARLQVLMRGEPRLVHGMILRAAYLDEYEPRALYRITLVPWLYLLNMRTDCRIFVHKTVPEIVAAVLADVGVPKDWYHFDLNGAYPRREYCTQYRESGLNFIHRLLEDEGIFYYFEHTERRHVVVFTDREGGGPKIVDPSLEFRPHGHAATREHISRFSVSEELRPERVTMRGVNPYDASEGSIHFEESKTAPGSDRPSRENVLQLYDFPAELRTQGDATTLVCRDLASVRATRRHGLGTSDCPRLAPGFAFTLGDHPLQELDDDYCVVRVHHVGSHPDMVDASADHGLVYHNDFVCIGYKDAYRAPRVTPRPTVRGVHAATVIRDHDPDKDDEDSKDDVYTDEYGRVKVQFHWDHNENTRDTCWVPVSQAWAGKGFGALFLPRIGDKVLVEFFEGNPDRPVITGRLHYTFGPPPVALPDRRSRSTIRTETFGGGGFHEIRFEDQPDAEQLLIRSQRDLDEFVVHDRRESVGNDDHRTIGNDRFEQVGRDQHTSVGRNAVAKVAEAADIHTGSLQLQVDGAAIVGVGED
ncbi:MAG TPA: type VI secretion system tip protein TssI/VgrG, partial [Nannocystis sp.]